MKMNRREVIKTGALTSLSFGCPSIFASQPNTAKAKAVIEIWLWGGPSHLDMFDPKPKAGPAYCGAYANPISTNVDGIVIGEKLPLLAKQADKYSIIRSMTHGNNGHETATYMMQTGQLPGGTEVHPCIGACINKFKEEEKNKLGLPNYIILTQSQGRFSEVGFLSAKYKPFATGGNPNDKVFAVEGIVTQGITEERQLERKALLDTMDTLGNTQPDNPQFMKYDEMQDKAFNMILGDARDVFDLTLEKDEVRDKYGRSTFGQSCLAARRLIEAGIKYVTINYGGWDTHKSHFPTLNQKLPEFDAGLATLLQELSDRGLLDSTAIWCTGEFGRTPKVAEEPPWNGGRHHFGQCFSCVVAGGGFKGGQIVGESDKYGQEPVNRPTYPEDIHSSIYSLVGIDPTITLRSARGNELPLIIKSRGSGILKEII